MRSLFRRALAHWYYVRRPMLHFVPLILAVVVLVLLGGYCFQEFEEGYTYARGCYIAYCLLFMEHVTETVPEHWFLRTLYVIMPVLGLVIILDGILRFSYHVLRREETGKEWVSAVAKTLSDHVILCGLGKMGLRVLEQLLYLGEQVIVLEKDPQCPHLTFARRHKVPVLIGNGREEGIFDDLNGAQAKSIILATDDDLANLEMALDARQVKGDIRVVLRMFDQELASKIRDSFDIHLALSTAALSAPLFATSSSDRSIVSSFYVDGQLLVAADLVVNPGSKLAGQEIRRVAQQH